MIPSELAAARDAELKLLRDVAQQGYGGAPTFAIKLAVQEAINNAIKHGNRFDPDKRVEITYSIGPDETTITISDEGDGFDSEHLPDPTAEENIEKPTGRGVMLMRAYMDEVRYNKKGNQVRLTKRNR